jgi:membrane protein involved in colicin uptake
VERVKFHSLSFALMNIRIGPDKSNNNRLGEAKSAIPIAGIVAAVALMSGLLSPMGSEIAIAQENMTGTNATAANATAANATAANATAANATAANATAANATAANATGALAGNQTNNLPLPGGNNTEGTTGGEASTGGSQAGGGGSSDPLAGIFGGG